MPINKTGDDADAPEAISYSETYRRAKRNALFWSAITIVVAVGTADAAGSIELTTVLQHLQFEQGFLTFAALATLLFMLAGYYRAEAKLLTNHSGFAVAARYATAPRVADKLVEDLTTLATRVQKGLGDLDKAHSRIHENFSVAKMHLESVAPWEDMGSGMANPGPGPAQGRKFHPSEPNLGPVLNKLQMTEELTGSQARQLAIEAVGSADQVMRTWLSNRVAELIRAFEEAQKLVVAPVEQLKPGEITAEGQAIVDDVTAQLATLSSDLRGFARSIGAGERSWFAWYDRFPTYTLAAIAIELALFRLFAPQMLVTAVDKIF
ncbi:hypothetical protein ABC955_10040 [Citromicrobium bathyomarinum]